MESCGLVVCSECGLVARPVYVSSRREDGRARKGKRHTRENHHGDVVGRVLESLAAQLGAPSCAVLELYGRLKKIAGYEAAAVALFVATKRNGSYVSLKKACELLSLYGVPVRRKRALEIMLVLSNRLRPTFEEALETYAEKLGLSSSVKARAAEILKIAKPYVGGRDPYLVALAAIHIASNSFTIYELAKVTKRSPGRIHANVTYLRRILMQRGMVRPPGFEPGFSGAEGLRAPNGARRPGPD